MAPRYRVTLTAEERDELETLVRNGKTSPKKFIRALALLLCDAGPRGPASTVGHTAAALGITIRTIEHPKRRFVEEGLDVPLERKLRKTSKSS